MCGSPKRGVAGLTLGQGVSIGGYRAEGQTAWAMWQDAGKPIVLAEKGSPAPELTVVPGIYRTVRLNWNSNAFKHICIRSDPTPFRREIFQQPAKNLKT